MRGIHLFAVLAAAMTLLAGCTHERFVADSRHPELEYSENGELKWRNMFINPDDLPRILDKSGVSRKTQIDIRVPDGIRSLKGARRLLFILRKAGYTRVVLVTEKRAYSKAPQGRQPPPPPPPARRNPSIRYK